MEAIQRQPVPQWALTFNRFNTFVFQDLLGGPKSWKLAWAINLHKILTPIVVVALMITYSNYSVAAWAYLALHSSYALGWLLKHLAFRDPRWEVRVTVGGAFFTFLSLATYWIAPFVLISRPDLPEISGVLLLVCIALHTLGVAIMIAADCQKHFTLKYRQGLITEGMYRYSRHPNYLGEMMIYASYALLAQHWLPWIVIAYVWITYFLVNMLVMEGSISRYSEWEDYREKTAFLIPGLSLR